MTKSEGKSAIAAVNELFAASPDRLREIVRAVMQEMLEAEMTDALGAEKGERTGARLGYRSGTLVTRIGKLELRVPQDRDGRFSTELFERYQRSEQALVATLAEMYVQGVSTRKVKSITEERAATPSRPPPSPPSTSAWTKASTPSPSAPLPKLSLTSASTHVGFQKAIDMSPRKRHHIRFWALSLERAEDMLNKAEFWFNIDRPPLDAPVLWIGAGTRDTGISLTKLTFQVTHATDSDTNAERDFILGELKRSGGIGEVRWHQEGERLNLGRVNHYVADHEVAVATLA